MKDLDNRETPELLQALEIAKGDLRRNYDELGIRAGPKNHREYWGRDGFWATLGSCSLGEPQDFDAVRRNLELFIRFQNNNGAIPLRIEDRNHGLFVTTGINLKHPPSSKFQSSQILANKAVDPTPLFIIAATHYANSLQDLDWVSKNVESLQKSASWILSKKNSLGLIEEGHIAGWADMTLRNGAVTYTNVLAWKALKDLGIDSQAQDLRENINHRLWSENQGHFVDHIDRYGRVNQRFYSDANVLAAAFEMATPEQSRKIYEFIDSHNLNRIPVSTYYQSSPGQGKYEDVYTRALFPYYNPKNIFGWWGPREVIGRLKIGDIDGATKDLNKLSSIIVRNGSTFEVVNDQGDPVDYRFYKSERSPAWAAGMFIYAHHELTSTTKF